ncbi:hypothetical protein G6F35_016701 [Rhizopus arrhizus]|nr:hypothetical protein G6F35_016701 [Rhizopus arrhizus]
MPTERIVMRSTVPNTPATCTTSFSFMPFSSWMKTPVMMSCTSFCAPKPMARPTTPAPAISGPTSMPICDSSTISVIATITISAALRNSASRVRSRALGMPRPSRWLKRCSMMLAITVQASAAISSTMTMFSTTLMAAPPASEASQRDRSNACHASRISSTTTMRMIQPTTFRMAGT